MSSDFDISIDRPPWMEQALCAQTGPADFMWFPDKSERAYSDARRTCAACMVKRSCLEYALDIDDQWGMYGGLTPNERKQLKRGGAA